LDIFENDKEVLVDDFDPENQDVDFGEYEDQNEDEVCEEESNKENRAPKRTRSNLIR
jgi:hypothetical protein